MAGTWICSKNYAFDQGVPLPGAIAQFYSADTLAPMVVYVDYALTTPAGTFVVANGNGQWPVVYLNEIFGFYRYRTIRPDGSILDDMTTLAIIGPGAGSGSGGVASPVDAAQLLKTGMFVWSPQTAAFAGFVRSNGGTIGAAGSVGSERHNADCQPLFTFLWTYFSNLECPVSGGRGLNALADFNSNKTIATPDLRGRGVVGLDKMGGASTAGRITSASTALPDDTGGTGGAEKVTLAVTQLPAHLHTVGTLAAANESAHTHSINPPSKTSGIANTDHTHTFSGTTTIESANPTVQTFMSTATGAGNTAARGGGSADAGLNPTNSVTGDHTHTYSGTTSAQGINHTHSIDIGAFPSAAGTAHTHTLSGSTANTGGGAAVSVMAPFMLGTWHIKL